jgi:hypothetical protein
VGSFEHDNEVSGFKKGREFRDELSDYKRFKTISTPYSYYMDVKRFLSSQDKIQLEIILILDNNVTGNEGVDLEASGPEYGPVAGTCGEHGPHLSELPNGTNCHHRFRDFQLINKIGNMYSLGYTDTPKTFCTPHHADHCCTVIRNHCYTTMCSNDEYTSLLY